MIMKMSIDEDDSLLVVDWDEKSPRTEADLHRMGGDYRDLNSYKFPLDTSYIKKVAKYGKSKGHKVRMSAEDKAKIKEKTERIKEITRLAQADSDAEVSSLLVDQAPETVKLLRNYQRAGIKFMTINESSLLADDPGSGKTLQTIATMISSDVRGDILVLAPSSAINVTWPAEIKKWAPEDEVVRVVGTRKKREEALKCLKRQTTNKRRWILCNFDMARAEYVKGTAKDGTVRKPFYRYSYPHLFFLDYEGYQKNKREWSAVVVDEAHQVLVTTKSQPYKQTLVRCGMGKLSVVEGGKRIAITGTPFRGKTHNIWGLLNWMFPSEYKSYWKWVERWFNTSDNYFGGTEITEVAYGKSADFYRSLAPFMLRRTKKEIAPELPPKMYAGTIPDQIDRKAGQEKALIGHWLEMSPKQAKAYDEMVEFAMSNLESGTLVANGVLAELTRLKQFSSCYGRLEKTYDVDGYEIPKFVPEMPSNKYDWLVEFLDELGIDKNVDTSKEDPESRKVVVASQFTSIINLYEKELNKAGIETLKVTGGVKMEDRESAVKAFQSDSGPRVFMLNTIAGGVSLTLDRADDIVILDETFIPDDQEQVEDRIHRVSRNHNVTVHYVRSIGTVEEGIAIKTFERNNVNKQLIDGERGVDFARQILSSR